MTKKKRKQAGRNGGLKSSTRLREKLGEEKYRERMRQLAYKRYNK